MLIFQRIEESTLSPNSRWNTHISIKCSLVYTLSPTLDQHIPITYNNFGDNALLRGAHACSSASSVFFFPLLFCDVLFEFLQNILLGDFFYSFTNIFYKTFKILLQNLA